MAGPSSSLEQWQWSDARPTNWSPQVRMDDKWVVVTFYTYCGKWKESIIRHQDTYRRGNYRARIKQDRIGQGPGGFAL